MIKLASDTHQWVVQIDGEPPPPEIPWMLIAGTITLALVVGIVILKRR